MSFRPSVLLLSLITGFFGAACGSKPSVTLAERPLLRRASFDPRDRPLTREEFPMRLDDASASPEFSPDTAAQRGPDRVFDFRKSAEGWEFTGGGAPEARDGLVWEVTGGREGIVSPILDVPFRDLRAIEVILVASAGRRMRLWWSRGDTFDDEKFSIGNELEIGEQPTRYLIRTATLHGYEGLTLRRLRLDPTDREAGRVRVVGIRLIGREGAYAGRGHGIGQETLANQIRHVVFHRVPSEIRWTVTVPAGGRLEVGCGLLDARAGATFTAAIEPAGSTGKRTELFRRVVSDDTGWHDESADLSAWAGRSVRLVLTVESANPGQVVLWSNPMIARAPTAADRPRPNVLLYLVDTLRHDQLGTYGNTRPTSPAVDAIGAEGAVFENCSSAGAWTRPSVASILTSLAPPTHGVTRQGLAIPDGVITLAEQMRQAGYVTAAFITSSHAGGSSNLQQGYDFLFETPAITGDAKIMVEGHQKDFSKKNSVFVNQALWKWLDRYADQPLFLYLHTMDPHAPYEPPPPYDTMFATGYQGPIDGSHDKEHGFRAARTPEEIAHLLALYDGDIRCNADSIGDLVDGLRGRGIMDRTLFVMTSDHGEEFLEHGGFEHGRSLYEEMIQVPLVMRLPGVVPAGLRVRERVSGLDVMPTILDVASIPANPDVQGHSLLPALKGTGKIESDVMSWRQNKKGEEEAALVRGSLKAIWSVRGSVKVFDLAADPKEKENIARSRRADAQALGDAARAWLESRPRIASDAGSGSISVDAQEREWLEALGYIAP